MVKECRVCNTIKPLDEFPYVPGQYKKNGERGKGHYKNRCKACQKLWLRDYHRRKAEERGGVYRTIEEIEEKREAQRSLIRRGFLRCTKCGKINPLGEYPKDKTYSIGYRPHCWECLHGRKKYEAVREQERKWEEYRKKKKEENKQAREEARKTRKEQRQFCKDCGRPLANSTHKSKTHRVCDYCMYERRRKYKDRRIYGDNWQVAQGMRFLRIIAFMGLIKAGGEQWKEEETKCRKRRVWVEKLRRSGLAV